MPAIGFAVGMERVLLALEESGVRGGEPAGPRVFIASVGPAQIPEALLLAESLRREGIAAAVNLEERPLKRQMEQASKQVPGGYAFILGEEEIKNGTVTVKEMSSGNQRAVPRADLVKELFRQ